MQQREQNCVSEDEIDLRELFLTLWKNKIFIAAFTAVVTLGAVVYVLLKNPAPIYEGTASIEIGEIQSKENGLLRLEHPGDVAAILSKSFEISADNVGGTTRMVQLTATATDKTSIKRRLQEAVSFIISRHKEKAQFFDHYIMTSQIGDITISDTPINQPKKKLIVVVAFVTGFILSVFLIFFKEFIKSFRQEDNDQTPMRS